VVPVLLAHGHNNSQTHKELLASTDLWLNAQHAPKDNLKMDTLVNNAQLDKSKIQTTSSFATPQLVVVNMISNAQWIQSTVEDANHAHGQE
jgi:hypothetical protein